MAFQNQTSLDVVYDNATFGSIIDPTQWNNNFKEIEDIVNENAQKIDANFDALESTTDGSSGADQIKATPLTGGVADTVQGIMEELDSSKLSDVVNDASPQLGGELDQNTFTIGGAEYDNGNSGTEKTIDWKKGNHQKITVNDDCTITFTNPSKPCMLSLRLINDAVSGHAVTLPTIKWSYGNVPELTSVANAIDILSLYFDGTDYYGQAGLNFI